MLQTVLYILARQLRLLETKVDLKIVEVGDLRKKKKKQPFSSSSTPSSEAIQKRMEEIEEEKSMKGTSAKKGRAAKSTDTDFDDESRSKSTSVSPRTKSTKSPTRKSKSVDSDFDETEEIKEAGKQQLDKTETTKKETKEKQKKRKKEDQDTTEDKGPVEKKAKKIKAREQKMLEKMSPAEKEAYKKQKEKEDKLLNSMSPEEKEKYLEQKENELNDLEQMSPSEREKFLKEKENELNNLQGMSPAEREKYFKGKVAKKTPKGKTAKKEKLFEKMTPKENELYRKQKQKEAEMLEKMTPKEKEMFLKQKEREDRALENMSPEERQKYFEEQEKELKALEKMSPKDKESYIKNKLKESQDIESDEEEELYTKDKEKEDKALQKISPKEKEKEEKALEKMSAKEKERYHAEKEKETRAMEKMSPKEKEKYLAEKKKQTKGGGSGTSIAITEVERQNEKVLVVEKRPVTRDSSRSSIEVVTRSQFKLLEAEVGRLATAAGPAPVPALPSDKKLKADLVRGHASLTDTMEAMQLSARVAAAEAGLARMADLLTRLAASGAVPDLAGDLRGAAAGLDDLRGDLGDKVPRGGLGGLGGGPRAVALDEYVGGSASRPSSAKRGSVGASVAGSRPSRTSTSARPAGVTRHDVDDAVECFKDDMMRNMQALTQRCATSAENAAGTARGIAEKMDVAMKLNARISVLHTLAADYAEQLQGFDAGLSTQMSSFKEQVAVMRADLRAGLVTLDTANNNAETEAVLELTERYNGLAGDLERVVLEHTRLTVYQRQLSDELRDLIQAVERLNEQKADRDEVLDGLRDKADAMKLDGLLTEATFERERAELADRLAICYDKFQKQEAVWIVALKELGEVAALKAEVMQLLAVKESAQQQLQLMQEKLKMLAVQLGEPKSAILTRLLSKDGSCGACHAPALMSARAPLAGAPPPLPALRPPPAPCAPALVPTLLLDDDTKTHICNRWVGGSHTLVPRAARERAPPAAPPRPANKYCAYGDDGRMYNVEDELQPCAECNPPAAAGGAGDSANIVK